MFHLKENDQNYKLKFLYSSAWSIITTLVKKKKKKKKTTYKGLRFLWDWDFLLEAIRKMERELTKDLPLHVNQCCLLWNYLKIIFPTRENTPPKQWNEPAIGNQPWTQGEEGIQQKMQIILCPWKLAFSSQMPFTDRFCLLSL